MGNISVDTSPQPDVAPISVDPGDAGPAPLPSHVIDSRADKAAFGTGRPVDDLRNQIALGNEQKIRQGVAAELDVGKATSAQQLLTAVANRKGGPLTTDEMNTVYTALETHRAFTNPKSVFEQEYGKKYIDTLYGSAAVKQDSWFNDAVRTVPNYVKQVTDVGKDYTSKDESLRTKIENLEAEAGQQPWTDYIADKVGGLMTFGILSDVQQRGRVPGTGLLDGVFLGNNLEAQRKALYRLPQTQFDQTLDEIDKHFAPNPSLKLEYFKSLLGRSSSDILAENFSSAMTMAAPGTGAGIKYLATRGGILKDVPKAVATMLDTPNASIYDTIFPNIPSPHTSPVVVAHAVGDLETAGVKLAARKQLEQFSGKSNPATDATEFITSAYKTEADNLAANPPKAPNSQEIVNRLVEANNKSSTNMVNMIQNIMKVNRVPEAMASETAQKLLREASKEDYKYLDSNFLDVKGPFPEPLTNTMWFEHQVGRSTAEMFSSSEEAAAFAIQKGIGLRGAAESARQLELQKLIYGAEQQLRYSRAMAVPDPFQTTAIKLGLRDTELKEIPPFLKVNKADETKLASYQKELADLRKTPGATVEQQGLGYYISNYVPLRETDKVTRDLLLKTPSSKAPDSLLKSFIGWIRTPEETASHDASLNARIAVQGIDNLTGEIKKELADIIKAAKWTIPGTSKKERWLELERTLKHARTMPDPDTGELGYLFRSPGELEDHYLKNFNRVPEVGEYQAYFAFKRYVDLIDGLKNLRLTTNKVRLGTQSHTIKTLAEDGKTQIESPKFDAIAMSEMPHTEGTILVVGLHDKQDFLTDLKKLGQGDIGKRLKDAVSKGELRALRVADPETRPLRGFGGVKDDRIRFVLAPNVESRPVGFQTISKTRSALFEQEHSHLLSQANMKFDRTSKHWWYEGDKNLMGFMNGKMAKDMRDIMENVRIKLLAKDEAGARAAAVKVPASWDTVKSWFNLKEGDGGHFSLKEPFYAVPKNKMTVQMDNSLKDRYGQVFRDGTKSGSDVRQSFFERNGDRDVHETMSIGDKGSRHNPIYFNDQDRYMDVIPSVNRSMNKIINSQYMDDYKMFSVEHWIQEAKKYLDTSEMGEVLQNPYGYFNHGEFKDGTPLDIKSRLMASRYKINQLIGTPSTTDTFLHFVADKLADTVYGVAGPTKLDPSWMIPKLTDAGRAIRAFTYHTTIGLFSIPQILVQNMNYITMAGIAGYGKAGQGTIGALMHLYGSINRNPAVLAKLDSIATNFGWKTGEWMEAHQLLQRSGFMKIGAGHALIDNPMSAKVFGSGKGMILDAGTMFFKGGEKSSRAGAWYIAYKEFRDLHPTGKVDAEDLRQIFGRAELLSGNMSKASKSILQTGPFAFTTQFLSYNMRLMELMTGKRLDTVQRSRLFLTFAGFYGVSAAGIVGFPFGDSIKQAAINEGYNPGEHVIDTLTTEGIPSYLISMITGKQVNFGQRYGSPGFDNIRDTLMGDKSMWNLLGGASWNQASNMLAASDGLRQAMMSIFRDDDKYYPLKTSDFTDMLTATVSTGATGVRTIEAINTGNWLSRKGQLLDTDIGPLQAVLLGLTGLQPQGVADVRNITALEKDRKQAEKNAETRFLSNFEKATLSYEQNDPEQGDAYMVRARAALIIGSYPPEKWGSLLQQATRGREPLVARAFQNFYLRNVPPEDRERLGAAFTKRLELQGK